MIFIRKFLINRTKILIYFNSQKNLIHTHTPTHTHTHTIYIYINLPLCYGLNIIFSIKKFGLKDQVLVQISPILSPFITPSILISLPHSPHYVTFSPPPFKHPPPQGGYKSIFMSPPRPPPQPFPTKRGGGGEREKLSNIFIYFNSKLKT